MGTGPPTEDSSADYRLLCISGDPSQSVTVDEYHQRYYTDLINGPWVSIKVLFFWLNTGLSVACKFHAQIVCQQLMHITYSVTALQRVSLVDFSHDVLRLLAYRDLSGYKITRDLIDWRCLGMI